MICGLINIESAICQLTKLNPPIHPTKNKASWDWCLFLFRCQRCSSNTAEVACELCIVHASAASCHAVLVIADGEIHDRRVI